MSERVAALVCPYCGAPLPRTAEGATQLTCVYCRATSRLDGVTVVRLAPGAPATGAPPVSPELLVLTIETFQAARRSGASPYDALVQATRARLGPLGETEAFARVVLALGEDFDRENGTRIVDDPLCMSRLIEGYLKAMEALRRAPVFDLSLPFITATSEGPRHFARRLSPAELAALAARAPSTRKKGLFGLW